MDWRKGTFNKRRLYKWDWGSQWLNYRVLCGYPVSLSPKWVLSEYFIGRKHCDHDAHVFRIWIIMQYLTRYMFAGINKLWHETSLWKEEWECTELAEKQIVYTCIIPWLMCRRSQTGAMESNCHHFLPEFATAREGFCHIKFLFLFLCSYLRF